MKTLKFFLLTLLIWLATNVSANTVEWMIVPEYDHIEFYSESVFKCVKKGKIQLFDDEGRCLLSHPVDSVTDFSDGFALALEKVGKNMRIAGVLDKQNFSYYRVDGNYYATYYSHCSEGKITVMDARGKHGYLLASGELAVPCQFESACPFCQGLASVSEKEREAYYIDHRGKKVEMPGLSLMQITDASNFNANGEALVGNFSKLFIINKQGDVVRKYNMKRGQVDFPVRWFDYVYDENETSFSPETNKKPRPDSRYSSYAEDKQVGIRKNGQLVAYAQFEAIDIMTSDFAIVRKDGKMGVLRFVAGDFSLSLNTTEVLAVQGRKSSDLVCTISSPFDNADDLYFSMDKGDGNWVPITLVNRQYVFQPFFAKTQTETTVRMKAVRGGLLLWQQAVELHKAMIHIEAGKPYSTSDFADADDLQRVKAVVRNRSSVAVVVKPAFQIALASDSKNQIVSKSSLEMNLAPGEQKECVVTFKVMEHEIVKVGLSVSYDGSLCDNNEADIVLEPFY